MHAGLDAEDTVVARGQLTLGPPRRAALPRGQPSAGWEGSGEIGKTRQILPAAWGDGFLTARVGWCGLAAQPRLPSDCVANPGSHEQGASCSSLSDKPGG